MNILEIQNSSIAKIETSIPFYASIFNEIKTAYEWFYFEIRSEHSHIVLIISLKDSFYVGNVSNVPSSVYLTWHIDDKLISYSYGLFENENSTNIQTQIKEFLSGKIKFLDLWLPDFSFEKYIHLKLHIPFMSHNENKNHDVQSIFKKTEKKHFWQFILSADCAEGSIETVYFNFKDNTKYRIKPPNFHDVLLKTRLKKEPCHRLYLSNARIYCDHNFGLEPLYNIEHKWYWWHSESKNYWDVTYYFPHLGKSYFCSSQTMKTEIVTNPKNEIFKTHKFSAFFFTFPSKIISPILGVIHFNKTIEAAPFYLRLKSSHDNHDPYKTSTLEVLISKRITHYINQILMSARQVKITNALKDTQYLEKKFSFSKICEIITKNNGRSFFLASLILSRKDQEKAYFVYTLCRLIDDATDARGVKDGALFSTMLLNTFYHNTSSLNLQIISQLKERLSYCLFSFIDENSTLNFIKFSKNQISEMNLEKHLFEELIAGQRMDECFSQPKNFDEFYLYCFRVAGVVGLMMTKIFKVQNNPKAFQAAEHLGIAMQITNILRDVKEDFEMGRVYLPQDICAQYGVHFNQSIFLNTAELQTRKMKLIEYFSYKALDYYESAISGIPLILQIRYRFCVRLMTAIYSCILINIIKNKMIVFEKRIVISRFQKGIIFLKVLLGFDPLSAAGLNKNFKKVKCNDEKI